MNDIRKLADCSNCLVKGKCDERVIEIYSFEEIKPNKPIEFIGSKEEQEVLDICKDCNNFLKTS